MLHQPFEQPSGDDTSAVARSIALSVAAPAYNEVEGIERVVDCWCECLNNLGEAFEIVICDDGSCDGTREVLQRLQEKIPQLRVIGREHNRGYGSAMTFAIAQCQGDCIATLDSDGQFLADDAIAMFHALRSHGSDAVLGYRVRKNDTWMRRQADRALNRIVRFLFGVLVHDSNCALKVINRRILQQLTLEATGFAFPTEVCVKVLQRGARCQQWPVRHAQRESGSSKLRVWRVGWQTFKFLLYLRFRLSLFRARILQEF
jgi:dolichol-phosphate mannosyltransferase